MAKCPVCEKQVEETDNFCSRCGASLKATGAERLRVTAIQEKIKRVRQNDVTFTIGGIVGVALAVLIPFAMRFILRFQMDTVAWMLTLFGVLLFIGCSIGIWYDNSEVKKLIAELERGPEQEEDSDG
jgi:hypothetical protein